MPFSVPLDTPITVICTVGGAPVLAAGRVAGGGAHRLEIELTGGAIIPAGSPVILELPLGAPIRRVVARVEALAGRFLYARIVRIPQEEKREYPRLQAFVSLRYRVAHGGEEAGWVRRESEAIVDRTPDSYVNFSATGLCFDDLPGVAEGDILCMTLSLPGDDTVWRCTARVVRVRAILPGEQDPSEGWTRNISVTFVDIPAGATLALAEYTLHIQDALLEGPDAAFH